MDTNSVQPPEENSPIIEDDGTGFNLQDFIPQELQEAVSEAASEEGDPEPVQEPAAVPHIEPAPITDESDQVDFSPEAIDRLIDGDINALDKQAESDTVSDEEAPFWADEEDYKELAQAIDYAGNDKGKLDTLMRKIADRSVVDNGTALQGLQKEINTYKQQIEQLADQAERGKEAMRGINFEADPEVQAKYIKPINDSRAKMQQILSQEGAKVNSAHLENITNKATLMRTLEENGVEDAKALEILGEWRAFQDTASEFIQAKTDAVKNSQAIASAKLSPDKAQNILKTSIMEMIEQEDYADMKTAIRDGIDKHADISEVINKGRNNFLALAQNMSSDKQQDPTLMANLAKFTINAAHSEHRKAQLATAREDINTWKDKAIKLAKELKTVMSSAGGIQGKPTSPAVARSRATAAESKSQDELAKEFEKKLADGSMLGGSFFAD